MKKNSKQDLSDYIVTLNMNGLQGRMINIPAKKQSINDILVIYGNHSTIEDWFEVLEPLSKFGKVTMPDMPGFGGMQSLYKIGEKPTIDNLADYLASFIKLRYKRKRITILAADIGFVACTRMLQLYPGIAKKVKLLVGINGFTRHDDLKIKPSKKLIMKLLTWLLSLPALTWLFKLILVNPRAVTSLHRKTNDKLLPNRLSSNTFKINTDDDIRLWRINDFRTHAFTTRSLLRVDNCRTPLKVETWNYIFTPKYFVSHNQKQHLRVVFSDINIISVSSRENIDGLNLKMVDFILSHKMKRLLSRPN